MLSRLSGVANTFPLYSTAGMLDADEFALASYLIKIKLDGNEIPATLPSHLVPPSKRELVSGRTQIATDGDSDVAHAAEVEAAVDASSARASSLYPSGKTDSWDGINVMSDKW